jgi:hypothetical protein
LTLIVLKTLKFKQFIFHRNRIQIRKEISWNKIQLIKQQKDHLRQPGSAINQLMQQGKQAIGAD